MCCLRFRLSFTRWIFSFCPPSGYCLTPVSPKPEKLWEPRRTRDSRGFCKWVLILRDVSETRTKPGFLPLWPDNDHSVRFWSPAGTVQRRSPLPRLSVLDAARWDAGPELAVFFLRQSRLNRAGGFALAGSVGSGRGGSARRGGKAKNPPAFARGLFRSFPCLIRPASR